MPSRRKPSFSITGSSVTRNNTAPSSLSPDLTTDTIPSAGVSDAAQIRALLKDQGLSDNVLNSIDDKTLVQMYNDSAKSVNGSMSNINANINADTGGGTGQ